MYALFRKLFLTLITVSFCALSAKAEIVEYNLDVDYKTVNITGKNIRAMSVDDSIPAPTIEATVGDILRVTFNNKMDVETSVHWHGVLLPNDQDGVPYLTTPPIQPGESFTYEYPIIHHGTYWYHSHTGLQEQRGVYGALVFHPAAGEVEKADHEAVIVLSDWTDEDPNQVMHNLKKSDDYYALKKNSVQSWLKVFKHGSQAISNRLNGAWTRMGVMDVSDVGYDAFLVNGEIQHTISTVKKGESIRLRIINAGASSYFNLEYAGGSMMIVAADGVDVEPVRVDRQRIAIAETFDVIVTIPDNGSYEFRATSEDGTGYSSTILGEGALSKAPDIPKPNPFLMGHSGHEMNQTDMGGMSEENEESMLMDHSVMNHDMGMKEPLSLRMSEYELLRSMRPTTFNPDNPQREVKLELTGNMERYVWSFNNKVLSEDSKIMIRKGETVRFVMENKTMMHHPIHLHGHFFRVLNGQGKFSPLKHTVNVPPMQTVTIEFYANEEKDWFFHCHNLYHMKSGMTRVISYAETSLSDKNSLSGLYSDRHWFHFSDIAAQSNFASGQLRSENTRNAFNIDYDWDYDDEYEVEITYERNINRFLDLYVGAEFKQEESVKEDTAIFGIQYLLPLMIEADLRVDSEGHGRLGLGSDLQLSDRLSFNWDANTDSEYRLQLEYELSKKVSIVGNHDDQFDWGVGVILKL